MKKLFKNEKGQGVMEYVIISGLVGISCLVAVRQLGEVVKKRIENMKSHISDEIVLKDTK